MKKKAAAYLVFAILLISPAPPPAQAENCLCNLSKLSNLLENPHQAQSAFIASIKFIKSETILTIEHKWKGGANREVRITGTWTGHLSTCNIPIEKEGKYLILSLLPASPLMSVSACDTIVLPILEAHDIIQRLDDALPSTFASRK